MTDQPDTKTTAKALTEMRDLLAAILREAGNRGIEEIVDLAGRADKLAADLLQQETNRADVPMLTLAMSRGCER